MDTKWVPNLSLHDGPKYRALAAAIRDGIGHGALPAGMKMPPVRELAWRLRITPGTVARAYGLLTDGGVLTATVGRGTFVAELPGPAAEPVPLAIDPLPHGTGGLSDEANYISPALPNMGQASLIRQLMAEIAEDPPSGLMHYPSRESFRPAREAVLHWLKGTPLGVVSQDDLVLSHGGQNGVCLALQSVLTGQRPVILVEQLSYPGFRRAGQLLRADVVPVPMDEQGIVPEALDRLAIKHGASVLCTSPEVHNPTCLFTPEARRHEIAEVARRRGLQVVEDDCYRMGVSRAPSYRALLPRQGWYVSSISKTLTPALRIGFVIAPEGRAADLRRAAEHGFFGLATPLADLATRLLTHPEVDRLTLAVTAQIGTYVETLVNHLGGFDLSWRRDVPFVWLRLPEGWRATAFCQAAAEMGVRIRSAEDFADRHSRPPHAVRIAINAQLPLEKFDASMTQLRMLLDNPPERIDV